MKSQILLATFGPAAVGAAYTSSETHEHADEHDAPHSGVEVEVKCMAYELRAKATVVQLCLRDHGRPSDVSTASAKLTRPTGTEKQTGQLRPASDNLEATGRVNVGTGPKAVAVVTINGKPATARFTLK